MSWIEFLCWQRYANKRAVEQRNAQARQESGAGGKASSLSSDEWGEFQERLKGGG